MRADSKGLWWTDTPSTVRPQVVYRPQPPIPDTGWRTPTKFPDLRGEAMIALDCETYDPDLLTRGPGWARNSGHIVGVSIACSFGSWYFPMRHEVEGEYNLEPGKVLDWLRDQLGNPAQCKVGANITYDIGWLQHEGVFVKGLLLDVQFAEALLNESSLVSLEALSQKYLNVGKASNMLYQWSSVSYGGIANGKQRANIYRCPPRLVGGYAEADAALPLHIIKLQWAELVKKEITDLFLMECKLIPLMIAMRFQGVKVDIKKAELVKADLDRRALETSAKIKHLVGFDVDVNKSAQLAPAFDKLGLKYGTTEKGAPSFTKLFLEGLTHPLGELIRDVRKYQKLSGTFIQSYILDSNVDGIVYGQFHQLRSDDGGTRSGRFSSSTPNLQNIPSRDYELAPLIRGMFLPQDDCPGWRKFDASQIEYRMLLHFAVGPGSEETRRLFNADPNIDYHDMVMGLVAPFIKWDISTDALRKQHRKPLKTINFGLIYGQGKPKLCSSLGLTKKAGDELFDAYHNAIQYAAPTMAHYSNQALRDGFVRTILGRYSTFDLWESQTWDDNKGHLPLSRDLALKLFTNIRRAQTHKALNRVLQGSAADIFKKGLLDSWESGILDVTGVPMSLVHDEVNLSDNGSKASAEAFKEFAHTMESAIKLRVPVRFDEERGTNWGNCK